MNGPKSCRRPVASLSHAARSYSVNRSLGAQGSYYGYFCSKSEPSADYRQCAFVRVYALNFWHSSFTLLFNNFCFVPGSRNPFVCTKETEKSDRKRERAAKTTHFVDKFISRRRAVISDT